MPESITAIVGPVLVVETTGTVEPAERFTARARAGVTDFTATRASLEICDADSNSLESAAALPNTTSAGPPAVSITRTAAQGSSKRLNAASRATDDGNCIITRADELEATAWRTASSVVCAADGATATTLSAS